MNPARPPARMLPGFADSTAEPIPMPHKTSGLACSHRLAARSPSAFTVLELLLAVTLTSLVVFALYSMFNQTQRALKGNVNQVDVMEGGRATTELMAREMEQMAPSYLAGCTNLIVRIVPNTRQVVQTLPAGTNRLAELRTNILQEAFFITRSNNYWIGIGYKVFEPTNGTPTRGAGALHRFAVATNHARLDGPRLYHDVMLSGVQPRTGEDTNFVRVVDGVIHIRITAYDASGRELTPDMKDPPNDPNISLLRDRENKTQTAYIFQNYALPAYVDLELGVLAPSTLEQFKSIPNPNAAREYLIDQAGSVSLFHQRIPIRTAPR